MATKLFILCVLIWISIVLSGAEDTCTVKLWCNDCITAPTERCAWCLDTDFSGSRCQAKANMYKTDCQDIKDPNNTAEFIKNEGFRDGTDHTDAIQLTPQHVNLTLRPGQTSLLDLRYRVSQNLPIDMYFVLDFSVTMKSRISTLADLTQKLINLLQDEFTKNIYIGFGSFLDKPIQPFHITTPQHLQNPCVLQGQTCDPSYGYIHRTRLNNDINNFVNTIRTAATSANFDPMEGGLDAMMQAAVCPDIIGWRNKTRRVMVYISDSGFHFAGDAKLAGIDAPNDGICHMERFNKSLEQYIYSHSTTLDYPSFGHLKKVLSENNINAFFVVKGDDRKMYEGLTEMIGTQAQTETMDATGAESIVNTIIKYYKELSSKLELKVEDLPEELEIYAETNCSDRVVKTFNLRQGPLTCSNLEIGKPIYINVSVRATGCPKTKGTVHTVSLVPTGLQESLKLDVDYICDCDCTISQDQNEKKCSQGNGTYECGVCRCNEGRSGETCQCDNTDSSTDLSRDEASCKRNNESISVCEDHGKCQCGQCLCYNNFGGKFCECDRSNCTSPGSSELCSGKDRGDCVCDTCVCKQRYQGTYCECPTNDVCLAENKLECSGKGKCQCGKCVCQADYSGNFCEKCPRCEICILCGNEQQKSCVSCLVKNGIKNNTVSTQCTGACSDLNVTVVNSFSGETCGTYDQEQCQINYAIVCDGDKMPNLQLAAKKQCVNPPDPLLIAMPVLGGIIGVGLLLLVIWKILTSFYDKIEYARFEHEIKNPKWSKTDNPIYKTPLTSNQNPVYKNTIED